jgi:hypothetical protein
MLLAALVPIAVLVLLAEQAQTVPLTVLVLAVLVLAVQA